MARIIIVWGLWGPYHCQRLAALRQQGAKNGHEVIGLSLFSGSRVNQWRKENLPDGVVHVNLGSDETRLPVRHIGSLLSLPRRFRADVALLPAYGHWSLVLNVGVRMAGGRVVMMNETHAGTVQARGLKAWFKQQVVTRFHAGFVGGQPQRRYFASLGLPNEKIYTGYDAVDNDYFAKRVDEVRSHASEFRHQYDLPENYFLSLGRFVSKKNLATLIKAYRKFLDANPKTHTHLVLVGSGVEEPRLRALCTELKLPTCDHREPSPLLDRNGSKSDSPHVHFYGFRQIDENPVFYALANAFVLPSLYEEWGLVVNEAMASGLPVVVSETAGCAEDLLETIPDDEKGYSLPTEQSNVPKKIRRNGFVFDPRSSDELGRVLGCLNSRPELRTAMGVASRQIIGKFSCENFANNALAAARASLG